MKSVLLSVKPQHVVNILNGLKTIEIRKKFPKDYVGWVYIYVTKGKPYLYRVDDDNRFELSNKTRPLEEDYVKNYNALNGKVVARFWCDKVEKFRYGGYYVHNSLNYTFEDLEKDILENVEKEYQKEELNELEWYKNLLKNTCLTRKELQQYVGVKPFCTLHITNLEIFDKPKELKDFKYLCPNVLCDKCKYGDKSIDLSLPICKRQVANPPQNYCYIEVDL